MNITECTHTPKMPTPAACVQCMAEGPVLPARPSSTELLLAVQWMSARFPTRCARVPEHEIEPGDRIGLVTDLGWCCEQCVRPAQERML